MTCGRLLLLLSVPLLVPGCLGTLDLFGNETVVTESARLEKASQILDDRIEDKHVEFDPSRTVVEQFDNCDVTLNKSATVTRLDVVPFGDGERSLDGALFPSRSAAISAVQAAAGAELIPSIEAVNGFLKPFNDGLYASIEVGVQEGIDGIVGGKLALLEALLARVNDALASASATQRAALEDAAVFLGAAIELGGATPVLTSPLRERAAADAGKFLENPLWSRPIGFYTWSPRLEEVFTQDRYLQNRGGLVPERALLAIAALLEDDATLRPQYEKLVALYAGLTNRYVNHALTALFPYVEGLASLDRTEEILGRFRVESPALYVCPRPLLAFLPVSYARDTDYADRKSGCGEKPAGSLIDQLIDGIRSGELVLEPDEGEGWYAWQLHALETLLVPDRGAESDHLLLTAGYKKKLIETFKSLITQTRETHVKQLAIGMGGDAAARPEVEVHPKFPVEPLPTFYLRTARAYRFLGGFLEATLGAEFVADRHRFTEEGQASSLALREELDQVSELLYGLYFLSARSVGLNAEAGLLADELAGLEKASCLQRAEGWLKTWTADRDVLRDPRVLTPVSVDVSGMRAWVVIGVKVFKVEARFVEGYEPKVVDGHCGVKGFTPHAYYLLSEQMVEVNLPPGSQPPTRDELRALCDEHGTQEAIVKALEAR